MESLANHSRVPLPPDYDYEVSRVVSSFFHNFYRFGGASNTFDLDDPKYTQFLQNLLLGSLVVGGLVFLGLCLVVVRRTFLHVPSVAYSRRWIVQPHSAEVSAVILLTAIAFASLSGLLGEAKVDYAAGVVQDSVANTSDLFAHIRSLSSDGVGASVAIRETADRLVVSFDERDLPEEAFRLSIESLKLQHSTKLLQNATSTELPTDLLDQAQSWEFSYFVLKSTTNVAILSVALASLLSMAAIGWALVLPLRVSILVLLSVVPISHTLIGVYLSSTILTSDFCAAPVKSTWTLVASTPALEYYLECPPDASLPFDSSWKSVEEDVREMERLEGQLETFAKAHGEMGHKMQKAFLDPIDEHIRSIDVLLADLRTSQECATVSRDYAHAVRSYCEYGVLGLFSMWVHQILLCLFLFVGVVMAVVVYERVLQREMVHGGQYQALGDGGDGGDDVDEAYENWINGNGPMPTHLETAGPYVLHH